MKPTTRGRPSKVNNNDIVLHDLIAKFLSIKEDKYKNTIAYFKIQDDKFKSKLKPLLSLSSDPTIVLPIWKTDKDDYLLKVKTKNIIQPSHQLKAMDIYVLNLEFTSFDFENSDGKNIHGYYSKLISYVSKSAEPTEGIESLDELDI